MNTSTRARRRSPSSLRAMQVFLKVSTGRLCEEVGRNKKIHDYLKHLQFQITFKLLCIFYCPLRHNNYMIFNPFMEKAFGDDGSLKQSKELSINKVGHALHEIEPVFKKFSNSKKVSNMFLSLRYKRPVVIQSMYIFKQPGIGGEVVPHQDNSFLYTEPPSCTGLWLALEDATITNGCLWAIPGSHKKGLVRRFIRDENGVHFDRPSPSFDLKEFVPLEVKAGSLVVIHGDLVHQSFENLSPNSRHALSLHVVDTDGFIWAQENWIRRTTDPEPLYVSCTKLTPAAAPWMDGPL